MDLTTARNALLPHGRRMRLHQNIHLRLPLDLLIRGQHGYVRRPLYARSPRKSADNYVETHLGISGQIEGVLLSLQP
jgi:hypothetical protein